MKVVDVTKIRRKRIKEFVRDTQCPSNKESSTKLVLKVDSPASANEPTDTKEIKLQHNTRLLPLVYFVMALFGWRTDVEVTVRKPRTEGWKRIPYEEADKHTIEEFSEVKICYNDGVD